MFRLKATRDEIGAGWIIRNNGGTEAGDSVVAFNWLKANAQRNGLVRTPDGWMILSRDRADLNDFAGRVASYGGVVVDADGWLVPHEFTAAA